MKYKILGFILCMFLFLPITVFADTATGIGSIQTVLDGAAGEKGAGFQTDVGTDADSIAQTIGSIINIFLGLVGAIATLYIIYGGFVWITAGGNDDKVQRAQKYIKNAAFGLIVASFAYVIVSLVLSLVTRTS